MKGFFKSSLPLFKDGVEILIALLKGPLLFELDSTAT